MRCTICKHPRLKSIHTDICEGMSMSEIAQIYGVSPYALQRHSKNHFNATEAAIRPGKEMLDGSKKALKHLEGGIAKITTGEQNVLFIDDIPRQLQYLYDDTVETMKMAKKKGDFNNSTKANKQALNCLELYFKASETIFNMNKKANQENEATEMRNKVIEALADYPEVKLHVARALSNK